MRIDIWRAWNGCYYSKSFVQNSLGFFCLFSNGFSLGGCGGGVVARQKQFAKPSPLSAEGICRLPSHGDVRLFLSLSFWA